MCQSLYLQHSGKFDRESLKFIGERTKWFRPVTLQELLLLKTVYPDARLVVGNTEVGKNYKYPDDSSVLLKDGILCIFKTN